MDDEMDAASTFLTRDQVLHAEIATFRAGKGQPMFDQEDEYNNPLDWWRIHAEKYPNIWKIARYVLAIQQHQHHQKEYSVLLPTLSTKKGALKTRNSGLTYISEREQGLCRMGIGFGFRRFPATQL
jgi:hypothetical protein